MIPFHWKVGEELYYSDVSAYIAGTSKGIHPEFQIATIKDGEHWRKEPPHSVFYYMDKVSKHIRDNYENIILLYSGGTDSHTILESFIRCGVRNVNLIMDNTEEHSNDSERMIINKWTTDSLKSKYKFIFTELNYTFNDHTSKENRWKSLNNNEMYEVLHSYKGSWVTSMYPAHGSSRYPKDLAKAIDRKTAIVWGYEKPTIKIYDDWFCWVAKDTVADYRDLGNNLEFDNIFFFYSDVVPELQVKLSYLKIKELTQIFKEYKITINNANLAMFQGNQIKYEFYKRINEACGYKAINEKLNSSDSKLSNTKEKSNYNTLDYSIANGNQAIIDNFKEETKLKIDDKYFDKNRNVFKGLITKPIKIQRVKNYSN